MSEIQHRRRCLECQEVFKVLKAPPVDMLKSALEEIRSGEADTTRLEPSGARAADARRTESASACRPLLW
jgi:hypothetical protein